MPSRAERLDSQRRGCAGARAVASEIRAAQHPEGSRSQVVRRLVSNFLLKESERQSGLQGASKWQGWGGVGPGMPLESKLRWQLLQGDRGSPKRMETRARAQYYGRARGLE
ncbi:hypothetical protein DR999_PMT20277 [Platysternon megacephalum]|uniref:Uncharacterized protein n=1 Tax=Platysternon megacephalum TaxID=55544 RepID=A0A4D9DSL2_9SAUR|nr:hypothetical protein DR999_PMT20277 [Platysternon megacephalum]